MQLKLSAEEALDLFEKLGRYLVKEKGYMSNVPYVLEIPDRVISHGVESGELVSDEEAKAIAHQIYKKYLIETDVSRNIDHDLAVNATRELKPILDRCIRAHVDEQEAFCRVLGQVNTRDLSIKRMGYRILQPGNSPTGQLLIMVLFNPS